MKKRMLFVFATAVAGASALSFNNDPLFVSAEWEGNTSPKVSVKKLNVGGQTDVSYSKTFAQRGEIDGKKAIRFATAVSGSVKDLTYTVKVEGHDNIVKNVDTVYKGISAGSTATYYNGTELTTTASTETNKYYWACMTIAFNTDSPYIDKDFDVSLAVKGTDLTDYEPLKANTSYTDLENADKTSYKVEYYFQKKDCSGYTKSAYETTVDNVLVGDFVSLSDTSVPVGVTDKETLATNSTGFAVNSTKSTTSGLVAEGGALTLKVYYDQQFAEKDVYHMTRNGSTFASEGIRGSSFNDVLNNCSWYYFGTYSDSAVISVKVKASDIETSDWRRAFAIMFTNGDIKETEDEAYPAGFYENRFIGVEQYGLMIGNNGLSGNNRFAGSWGNRGNDKFAKLLFDKQDANKTVASAADGDGNVSLTVKFYNGVVYGYIQDTLVYNFKIDGSNDDYFDSGRTHIEVTDQLMFGIFTCYKSSSQKVTVVKELYGSDAIADMTNSGLIKTVTLNKYLDGTLSKTDTVYLVSGSAIAASDLNLAGGVLQAIDSDAIPSTISADTTLNLKYASTKIVSNVEKQANGVYKSLVETVANTKGNYYILGEGQSIVLSMETSTIGAVTANDFVGLSFIQGDPSGTPDTDYKSIDVALGPTYMRTTANMKNSKGRDSGWGTLGTYEANTGLTGTLTSGKLTLVLKNNYVYYFVNDRLHAKDPINETAQRYTGLAQNTSTKGAIYFGGQMGASVTGTISVAKFGAEADTYIADNFCLYDTTELHKQTLNSSTKTYILSEGLSNGNPVGSRCSYGYVGHGQTAVVTMYQNFIENDDTRYSFMGLSMVQGDVTGTFISDDISLGTTGFRTSSEMLDGRNRDATYLKQYGGSHTSGTMTLVMKDNKVYLFLDGDFQVKFNITDNANRFTSSGLAADTDVKFYVVMGGWIAANREIKITTAVFGEVADSYIAANYNLSAL